jgi:hypothetical protein
MTTTVAAQIKKFNPKNMDPCRVCVFLSKRGMGKSTLIKDILYHQRRIPMGVIMSGTEESNEHYKEFVPDSFVYGQYEPSVIGKIIEHQQQVVSKMTKEERANTREPSHSVLMVLDDCMFDNKWTRDKDMRCVFMNGRHYRIFFMLSMQYCMDLPPALRANIDYIFVLKENIIQNKEKIYKNFFGIFPTFDSFNDALTQCTENYNCLVLDNTAKSNKIEDVVFWYKAKVDRKFRLGSPGLWEHHFRNYNKNHATTGNNTEGAGSNVAPKKKTPNLKIIKMDSTGTKKKKG